MVPLHKATYTLILVFAILLTGPLPTQSALWEFVGPIDSIPITAFYVYPDNTILAGSACRVLYKSTDEGKTWDTLYNNLPYYQVNEFKEALGYLWVVLADYGPGEKAVQWSADRGKTWNYANYPTSENAYCITTIGNKIYVGGNGRIFYSSDTAKTFSVYAPNYGESMLDIIEYNDTVYFNASTGIYYSDRMFSFWNWGPGSDAINSMVLCKSAIVAAGDLGVIIKPLEAKQWESVITVTTNNYQRVHQINDSILYAGFDKEFYYSTNSGYSWTTIGNLIDLIGNDYIISDIVKTENYTLMCNKKGIYRKKNDTSTQINTDKYSDHVVEKVCVKKNTVSLHGFKKQLFIAYAYSLKGQLLFSGTSNSLGILTLNIGNLPKGLLVILVNQDEKRQHITIQAGIN